MDEAIKMENSKKIFRWLLNGFYWIKGSGDNKPGGASSKKLTGLASVLICVWVTRKWALWAIRMNDFALLPYVLGAWFSFGAAALAINGFEKLNKVANTEDGTEGPGKISD